MLNTIKILFYKIHVVYFINYYRDLIRQDMMALTHMLETSGLPTNTKSVDTEEEYKISNRVAEYLQVTPLQELTYDSYSKVFEDRPEVIEYLSKFEQHLITLTRVNLIRNGLWLLGIKCNRLDKYPVYYNNIKNHKKRKILKTIKKDLNSYITEIIYLFRNYRYQSAVKFLLVNTDIT